MLSLAENTLIKYQSERRLWPRLKVNWHMRLVRSGDAEPIRARLDDISGGGLLFTSESPITCGVRLICQIVLPMRIPPHHQAAQLEYELIAVRAELNHSGYRIACQFGHYCLQSPPHEVVYWRNSALIS